MVTKIHKFNKLSFEEKKLFFQAFVILGIMRFALLTLPFKLLTRSLDQQKSIRQLPLLSQTEMNSVHLVSRAINRAVLYTPWKSTCLVQALTAHRMLYRYNLPGVLYVGIVKDKLSNKGLEAHAWSQCGNKIVTGAAEHELYTVISVFKW